MNGMVIGLGRAVLAVMVMSFLALPTSAQEQDLTKLVEAFKANMAESQVVLRQYEWVESTVYSYDGNDARPIRKLCYYDATGELRKENMPQGGKRFRSGVVPADELEGLNRYVQDAIRLLRQYIPLNLSGIQSAQLSGNLYYTVVDPGRRGRMTISNFLFAGDRMELELDLAASRPLSMKIGTYLESPKDSIVLNVNFGSLYGTASFVQQSVLEAKARDLKITIQNTDYIKVAP